MEISNHLHQNSFDNYVRIFEMSQFLLSVFYLIHRMYHEFFHLKLYYDEVDEERLNVEPLK
jgi:hypothetical protein